jgi:cytochrome b
MTNRILIWDLPTRVFHWLQVISIVGAYSISESERYRDVHIAFGYLLLGLIVFRLLWGFVGTRYARFNSFFFKPGEIIAYLLSLFKGRSKHYLGHNPAGSVSVWLLLSLGLLICVTGVMALQDDAGDAVVTLHGVATKIMLAVVLLHILGVLVSSILHRENLLRAMIIGLKSGEDDEGIRQGYNWIGAAMLIVAVAFWFVFLRASGG